MIQDLTLLFRDPYSPVVPWYFKVGLVLQLFPHVWSLFT